MIKEYITRQHYLDRIRPYIGKDIIKVITGQRRVGKSYLLFQIMDVITAADLKAQIIYINKELYEFDFINNYKALLKYIKDQAKGKKNQYVSSLDGSNGSEWGGSRNLEVHIALTSLLPSRCT